MKRSQKTAQPTQSASNRLAGVVADFVRHLRPSDVVRRALRFTNLPKQGGK